MSKPSRTLVQTPSLWRVLLPLMLGALLGGRVRKFLYRKLCHYSIAPDAIIGHAFIQVASADIGPKAKIGTLSIIRNLERLELAPKARIGTFNWIFGMLPSRDYFTDEADRVSALIMEEDASLTSRHIVDATATVTIGAYATVAGFRSQILSHGIDVITNTQRSAPIKIGAYTMIGSNCLILKGAIVPDTSIVGAGSMFRAKGGEPGGLWSGNPAKRVRDIDVEGAYFTRMTGHVS